MKIIKIQRGKIIVILPEHENRVNRPFMGENPPVKASISSDHYILPMDIKDNDEA